MWFAWRHGAALVPAERALVRSGAELGPWLADRGVRVISIVPTLAALWDEDSLAGVRLLILGGELVQRSSWRLSADREVWNTYEPTEATVVATAAPIKPGQPVTIGWPLDGWEVAVLDAGGEPAGLGEPGELVIGGVGLGRYLDPVLDARRFAGVPALGWDRAYRTGDVVRETIAGIEFGGRRDDQVKLGGRRIELGEIDAALSAVPGVRAALSAVRESAAGHKLLVGYVVGKLDPAVVRASVAERLPEALGAPDRGARVAAPGVSGKVDRKALPWPPPAPRSPTGEAAWSATASWLAEQWRDQLGPLPIDLDSNFFELGGSSLAAAKLASALRGRFPAMAVADVYNHSRLSELAERLDRLGSIGAARSSGSAPRRRSVGPGSARRRVSAVDRRGAAAARWDPCLRSLASRPGRAAARLGLADSWLVGVRERSGTGGDRARRAAPGARPRGDGGRADAAPEHDLSAARVARVLVVRRDRGSRRDLDNGRRRARRARRAARGRARSGRANRRDQVADHRPLPAWRASTVVVLRLARRDHQHLSGTIRRRVAVEHCAGDAADVGVPEADGFKRRPRRYGAKR